MKKKVDKKVDRKVIIPKITKSEKEVLKLLTEDYLTPKQIQIRRQTSRQAVHKIIKKLKEKGVLNQFFEKVDKSTPTCQPKLYYRYHGVQLHIGILWKDHRYEKILNKSNLIQLDNNTIRIYPNCIEVYIRKDFISDTEEKATIKGFEYFNRIISKLENNLSLILIKQGYQNIKIAAQHYSEVNNELAKETNLNNKKIKVYTNEDGKLWFSIDYSFNLNEAETLHPKTAQKDMRDVIVPYFNDLREKESLLPSETTKVIQSNQTHIEEIAKLLKSYLESQIPQQPKDQAKSKQERFDNYFG